jgi:hypothetical protein
MRAVAISGADTEATGHAYAPVVIVIGEPAIMITDFEHCDRLSAPPASRRPCALARPRASSKAPPADAHLFEDEFGTLRRMLQQRLLREPLTRLVIALPGTLGLGVLARLFDAHGYMPRVLERALLPIEPKAELARLTALERAAMRMPAALQSGFGGCELYADAHGEERINAADGAVLVQRGLRDTVHRPWYVFEATLASAVQ